MQPTLKLILTLLLGAWLGATVFFSFVAAPCAEQKSEDRKSTRLNSSHSQISYAVFCLKKKKHNAHYGRFFINIPISLFCYLTVMLQLSIRLGAKALLLLYAILNWKTLRYNTYEFRRYR